jgi:hypothetical protein
MTEEIKSKDIFEDFDTELFNKPTNLPTNLPKDLVKEPEELEVGPEHLCPYFPKACDWVNSYRCNKDCQNNPESFMDPKIKEVFDEEPWSNWCFTCGEFIPSRNHENALDPPELIYSHTVATGYHEYKIKLSKWVIERMTGKDKPGS